MTYYPKHIETEPTDNFRASILKMLTAIQARFQFQQKISNFYVINYSKILTTGKY